MTWLFAAAGGSRRTGSAGAARRGTLAREAWLRVAFRRVVFAGVGRRAFGFRPGLRRVVFAGLARRAAGLRALPRAAGRPVLRADRLRAGFLRAALRRAVCFDEDLRRLDLPAGALRRALRLRADFLRAAMLILPTPSVSGGFASRRILRVATNAGQRARRLRRHGTGSSLPACA